jgi:hypothetical protein
MPVSFSYSTSVETRYMINTIVQKETTVPEITAHILAETTDFMRLYKT